MRTCKQCGLQITGAKVNAADWGGTLPPVCGACGNVVLRFSGGSVTTPRPPEIQAIESPSPQPVQTQRPRPTLNYLIGQDRHMAKLAGYAMNAMDAVEQAELQYGQNSTQVAEAQRHFDRMTNEVVEYSNTLIAAGF